MVSTQSIINNIREDYPDFTFQESDSFLWSAPQKTVFYDPGSSKTSTYLLHELSHAILGHIGYKRDIELIKMERDAWEYAKNILSKAYNIKISPDVVQINLDTYRRWLHKRSTCTHCLSIGIQSSAFTYGCPVCNESWKVNDARLCELRRHSIN